MALSQIRKQRLEKLEALKRSGADAYPRNVKRTHVISEALLGFSGLSNSKEKVVLVGRIISVREHGGATFLHFKDGEGKIQAYLKKDRLGQKEYKFFLDNFDIGDIVEIQGILFETKRGEKTIEASDFRMLAKDILPLPEKWHGLQDVEERFRKRYLDLIMNEEIRSKFKLRSRIIRKIREILDHKEFIEVETPILQPIPGGAFAKPFKTHLNALKMDLYLRVAPELYLKRLLVGGFEKIYEIGRCFRNEGMDKHHNPDFTMMELYWAYKSRDGLMEFVESFFKELAKEINGSQSFKYQGKTIDLSKPFARIKFRDLLKEHCNIDIEKTNKSGLKKKLNELGIKPDPKWPEHEYFDALYKKACLPNLVQPIFMTDHPIEMNLLSRAKEDNKKYADRFQLIIGGIELVNGFSELNDPIEQKKRFESSNISPERKDKDFIDALEYGMPPTAGLGLGIDRLIVLLTDSHSLREVILFPTMRPIK